MRDDALWLLIRTPPPFMPGIVVLVVLIAAEPVSMYRQHPFTPQIASEVV